ncbi:MAG: glycogen/starch synthase [Bacteroidales bacterium]|nr:glycogen/starch synthase [Bacteroidales bacterium]
MAKKRILYVAPEIFPYLQESYTSNVCRFLPQGIQERENEIRTFMPKFGCINERKNQLHEVIRLSGQNIIVDNSDHPLIIKVASLQVVRMQIYFIDSDDYFKRKQLYRSPEGAFFDDNDERMIFFAKGVIETVRKLGWAPDIIHCHGWITSLLPIFIKTCYKDNPFFQDTRIVYSIYNDQFDEKLDEHFAKKLAGTGIDEQFIGGLENAGFPELMKKALEFSDAAVIAHPDIDPRLNDIISQYQRPLFTHPAGTNPVVSAEYVDQYNDFYDDLMQKSPMTF